MARRRAGTGAAARLRFQSVHGYRRAYRMAGSGPALLLLHGIGDSSESWAPLIPALARRHTVIAPDLLGHGACDKPRADYAVPSYANGMRDLLDVLGVDRVTVVGDSLCRGRGPSCRGRSGWPASSATTSPATATTSGDGAQEAFTRTLRSVVDWRGQVVSMLDRIYLAGTLPTLVVWGDRDGVIPVAHAHRAHAAMPGSRLEIFAGAGHFPHHADPERFVALVEDFVAGTRPGRHDPRRWRRLLRGAAAA